MIKIGITGGIGSGKSLICRVFSKLDIPVYYADIQANMLTESDPEIRKQLISAIGKEIYSEGRLNRPFLSDVIFRNKDLLDKVNSIIHPRVKANFREWCLLRRQSPYIMYESAIIFESGYQNEFDRIIAVVAPENIRIFRVLERKNMTVERIRSIMNNQLPEVEIMKRSDHTIVNDDKHLVIPQVLSLHHKFLEYGNKNID